MRPAMTPSEVLVAAKTLLAEPGALYGGPDPKPKEKYRLWDAIWKPAGIHHSTYLAGQYALSMIPEGGFCEWEDGPNFSHENAMMILDGAIKAAQEAGE